MEEENIIAKITVKTLTDRTIKIDFTSETLTLQQLKEQLVERVELPVEQQFFVMNGVTYGKDMDKLQLTSLPGFKAPGAAIAEFKDMEQKRISASKVPDQDSVDSGAAVAAAVKTIDELLPVLYLFHYEPLANAPGLDPLELASDWSQKNRLKFFKGVWAVSQRRLADAAKFLVDALPTFEETGFMSFKSVVKYTVIAAAVAFDRPALKAKIIRSPEVLECIKETPHLEAFINSLYNCRYREFFAAMAALEPSLKQDWLIGPHAAYFIKEMRIRAYSQLLYSYSSLSLAVMADSFGVSVDFIDAELCRFIAAGRLSCVIDKVNGVVLANNVDLRSEQYLASLKQGDQLISKIHKLSRVITF